MVLSVRTDSSTIPEISIPSFLEFGSCQDCPFRLRQSGFVPMITYAYLHFLPSIPLFICNCLIYMYIYVYIYDKAAAAKSAFESMDNGLEWANVFFEVRSFFLSVKFSSFSLSSFVLLLDYKSWCRCAPVLALPLSFASQP